MSYTDQYKELARLFNPGVREITLPGSGMKIVNTSFTSEVPGDIYSGSDFSIQENITFSYPVFVPPGRSNKVILLFHGLNERSWIKYLTWAYYLSAGTDSYVILFPISFHMNRSPVSWSDPRQMMKFLGEKSAVRGEVRSSSFANIALSNRLSDDPTRFIKSGYQTVSDVVKLMKQIRDGADPVVPADSEVNVFAYSIGAYLSEILMMADPGGYFSGSKLFMFCGGSVFGNMFGESKLIMDRDAYEKVHSYYMDQFEEDIQGKTPVLKFIASGKVGMAFRSMISFARFRDIREKALVKLRERISVIALLKDKIIPAAGIGATLGKGSRFKVLDFPYDYIHENPFPVSGRHICQAVDSSFERVFDMACRFLS